MLLEDSIGFMLLEDITLGLYEQTIEGGDCLRSRQFYPCLGKKIKLVPGNMPPHHSRYAL